ncbi:hypothetical protein FOA52_010809 [Chlamydomonas sp. UWO 241]|nr:hypothetical protein FOA52_010809 [Chlamydomonas sp. UWO 241]
MQIAKQQRPLLSGAARVVPRVGAAAVGRSLARPLHLCAAVPKFSGPGLHRSDVTPVAVPLPSTVTCASAAAGEAPGGERNFKEMLLLTALFAVWYGSNIMFNVFNKELFTVFKYPITTTCVQFLIGSIISLVFWTVGAVKKPENDPEFFKAIYPLAIINVLGNVLTNVSLGLVAVSFTHTVKAAEPFFSVIFSWIFLGDLPPYQVLLTLLPIVGGVVIASASEASFNWGGFLSAIASNVTFQSRNVLSKKFMNSLKGKPDSMMLFQVISVMSFITLLPIAIFMEGMPALPSSLAAAGFTAAATEKVYKSLLFAGFCFHGYQQLSYIVLSRLSPVSHSVGNSCKRVAVIVASLIWFRNPISVQNAVGTSMALVGVFLYSQAKRITDQKKP